MKWTKQILIILIVIMVSVSLTNIVIQAATPDSNKYATIEEVKTLLSAQTLKEYPVGSIYLSTSGNNPGNFLGGSWTAWGTGRVPVGINTNDGNFNSVEKTGGSITNTLSVANLPSHNHTFTGSSVSTSSSGSHTHTYNSSTNVTGNHVHDFVNTPKDTGDLTRWVPNTSVYRKTAFNAGIDNMTYAGNHSHTVSGTTSAASTNHSHTITPAGTIGNTGSASAVNNLQPYITCYMWKRIS